MYTITLSDGTQLKKLALNGNNFISSTEVTDETFEGKLARVTINDGENEEVLRDAQLIQITEVDGKWWFILRETPASEKELSDMNDALIDAQLAIADVYEMITGGAE